MRSTKCMAAAAAFMMICPAMSRAQETKRVETRVAEATVFLHGAELLHTAQARVEKGAGEITLEGLSPDIDQSSLRVGIGGGVVISSYEFSIDYLGGGKRSSASLRWMLDSINIYKADLSRIEIDIKVNSGMQGYLETGIAKNVSGSEAGLGIEELKKTMDYYKSKSEEILNGAEALKRRQRALNANISRLQSQYDQESGLNSKTSGILRLSLSAPAAGTFPVSVTYYTAAAGWTPYYEINVASTDKPVKISAKSRVMQATGLDWENVRLTLSTATPSNGRVAPLFSAWMLRPQSQTRVRLAGVSMAAPAAQNAYSYESLADEVVVEYGAERKQAITGSVPALTMDDFVNVEANAINVTYNIDIPYTIPGNGKEQNIDLTVKEAAAEYKYYCAPRLDPATYLLAEIPDWQQLGLLSGRAGITYAGTYLGETFIDASSTLDKLALTLGADKRVAVTRELLRENSAERVVGSDVQRTYVWKMTVRNNQPQAVRMTLKDQYPISTQKDITVELLTKETTPWTANKTETGVVTWEAEFAPGESRTYRLGYSVRHPQGMTLNL